MHRLSGGMYVTGTSRWLKTDPDVQTAHVRLTDPDTQIVWLECSWNLRAAEGFETDPDEHQNQGKLDDGRRAVS